MKRNKLNMHCNERKIYETFLFNGVSYDHYTEGNGIYRFSGIVHYELNKNDADEFIGELLIRLYNLEIIPSRVFIYWDYLEIDWYPNSFQIVTEKDQYLKVALEFSKFLDKENIKGLTINLGSFDDDPETFSYAYKSININPSFNKRCFGSNKIDIIDARF